MFNLQYIEKHAHIIDKNRSIKRNKIKKQLIMEFKIKLKYFKILD